jgi:membrane associated rhomboid family serine protease
MSALRRLNRPIMLLGHSFPLVAVGLAAVTLLTSILTAVAGRGGLPLLELLPLSPRLVAFGQLWRLATWVLAERDALSLVFVCLVLLWCGRDLAYAWGPGRLLGVYFGVAAAAGALTTLVGFLAWPAVFDGFYLAPWAIGDALILAWASLFPHRPILFMFVLRLAGRQIVWAILGLVTVMALLDGPARYVPHFVAMGAMAVYVRGESPRTLWLRLRFRLLEWQRRRGRAHLRPVERPADRWRH